MHKNIRQMTNELGNRERSGLKIQKDYQRSTRGSGYSGPEDNSSIREEMTVLEGKPIILNRIPRGGGTFGQTRPPLFREVYCEREKR